MTEQERFAALMDDLRAHGMQTPEAAIRLRLEGARELLGWTFAQMLASQGKRLIWQSEYEQVAHWLTDTEGRGLFLQGAPGRGKTYLARYVLPAVILQGVGLVARYYDATTLGRNLDDALRLPIVVLDDLGTESTFKSYGNTREAFAELVDAAEKQGKLLIVTSNLSLDELLERYDGRSIERLLAVTRIVQFSGESLRR